MSKETLLHISEKPWGEISEADYTLEQWHNACLIHLHSGPPTSKSQCKLPVRTPSGALNRNGVHAAAAALAGARAPLQAPLEQKAKAAAALRRYYGELDETPPDSLKQSSIVDDILEHFGTKGMKWGVRKSPETIARRNMERMNKQDAQFRKKTRGNTYRYPFISKVNTQIMNASSKSMKSDVKILNKKPEYRTREAKYQIKKNKNNYDPDPNTYPIAAKYCKEFSDIYMKHVQLNAPKFMKTSASGRLEHKLQIGKNYWTVSIVETKTARHADLSSFSIKVRPVFDDDGYIIDVEVVNEDLAQSAIDSFLAHFGVKGMKWGVRRERSSSVTVSDRRKKIKTSGGYGLPAHADALRARRLGQVGKSSGLKALSNEELQTYAHRLQLEQNVKRLNYNEMNPGKKFVATILGRSGNALASQGINEGTKKLGRRAVKLAMA